MDRFWEDDYCTYSLLCVVGSVWSQNICHFSWGIIPWSFRTSHNLPFPPKVFFSLLLGDVLWMFWSSVWTASMLSVWNRNMTKTSNSIVVYITNIYSPKVTLLFHVMLFSGANEILLYMTYTDVFITGAWQINSGFVVHTRKAVFVNSCMIFT